MKKIIFLDIDGVLNVIPQGRDRFGSLFHPHLVENLKYIIEETNAEIVISSTWRFSGLSVLQTMWEMRGLPGEVIDTTPWTAATWVVNLYDESSGPERGYEIQEWIDKNNPDRYVIIDDDDDFLNRQFKYFVKTSDNQDHDDCIDIGYGLTRKCAERVIKILNEKET